MNDKDEFVRVKMKKETRRLLRLLAAKMDVTMIDAVHEAVVKKLDEIERAEKK